MSNTSTLPGLPSAPRTAAPTNNRFGRKNIYLCHTCGHGVVTQDAAVGTTPFSIACDHPGCQGHAFSLFYAAPQPILAPISPAFEWYAPTEADLVGCSADVREHVSKGGLLKRRPARAAQE